MPIKVIPIGLLTCVATCMDIRLDSDIEGTRNSRLQIRFMSNSNFANYRESLQPKHSLTNKVTFHFSPRLHRFTHYQIIITDL